MWYVYLSLALQIILGIHAVKTGRSFVWVLIIIVFSVFGCLGYILIELLPEWLKSRGGHQVKKAIGNRIDPEKSLRAAQKSFEQTDSVQNRINLAEQYFQFQRFNEAKELYAGCLSGLYAEDPQILLGMARAEFALNNFEAVIGLLNKLKASNPDFKSAEGHLLYARALENSGQLQEAIHEYEALNTYYSTPEPVCRLAQIYQAQGKKALAEELYQSVVKRSATAGKHFNDINKEWVNLAKQQAGNS